jgi:hypothetical protein
LAGAHRIPQGLIDDPELRDLARDPVGLWIETRDALSGVRVLGIAQAVPDLDADIELVV